MVRKKIICAHIALYLGNAIPLSMKNIDFCIKGVKKTAKKQGNRGEKQAGRECRSEFRVYS